MINKSFVAVSLILALAISFNFFNKVSYANEESTPAVEVQSKQLDDKAEILSSYLSKHNSPLQYHSQDFIDAAKQYNLDWKLVPAIAGVESTFGKHIPGGYNGWGWGVY
ncbi:MAG: hypothetical protein Q7R49_00380, partial [Candidatus Daviesbacteria bacterium]|nr:hypothetical protein [Candidatus Daviesbacteria bacterium]